MKQRLCSLLLLASFAVWLTNQAFSQGRPPLVDAMGYADRILVNGKIVSMDDRSAAPETPGRIHQAMAIKGKKIMALGSNDAVRSLAGPQTTMVDLGGRTVIPGLVQPHYHLYNSAGARYGPKVGMVDPSVKLTVVAEKTAEATAKKIRDTIHNAIRVQNIPRGQWITVALQEGRENRPATNRSWLYLGKINKRQIDSATSDHPVLVRGRAAAIFNSVAVAEFKRVFPDWEEHTELENGPGSAGDGYLANPEMQGLTFDFWWKDKPLSDLAEVMRLQGLDVLKDGITTVGTRMMSPRVIAAFNLLNRQGKLPHRLAYFIEIQRGNFFNLKSMREFYQSSGAPWTNHANGGEMLWLNGMCNEIWDSTQNEVCMGPDMPASADIKARERCPAPGTKPWETFKTAIVAGWRPVQAHGTSSHGARLYVQMLEQAMKEGNYSLDYMRGLRTTLEHNFLLGNVPDVMAGIKKFGIIINVSTGYLAEVPELIRDYGEPLRKFAMPVKTWIQDGVRVTFEAAGTDVWTPIYTLVTRKVPKGARGDSEEVVILPEEAIDRVTALKMETTWASEYVMAEETLGTLEPGKFADFAVLDKDFFTIPVEEIRNIRVVMTGLSGNIVHDGISAGGASAAARKASPE
ncbi:MAG: amidohydrolase family protein [Acidobacteria bacterium]|nr:amidohydrolase family protein [Acidobacteriota bacterium]